MVGINSNLASASASRNLTSASATVSSSIAKLSSGTRIIKASDDVAGLAIGTSIDSAVKSLKIAKLNTEQARSVLSIADGALKQIGDILARQKALAVQSNSGSLGNTQRAFLNQEFTALKSETDRIVANTSFNGITLLNGSIAGDANVTVSAPLNAGIIQDADVAVGSPTSYSAVGTAVTSGVITGAPTISLASFADATIGSTNSFGTFTAINYSDSGANDTFSLQTTINGKVYQSAITTATGGTIPTTQAFTFTEVGGTSAFSVTLANSGTTTLASQGNANTLATDLTASLAPIDILQNRTVSGLNSVTGTALAGINVATQVSIRGSSFDSTNNDFGTIGQFNVVAGADTANYVTVTLNGKTFSASDLGGANDSIAANEPLTLIGRDSIGADNGERLTITLTSLAAPIDISSTEGAANLEVALNQLFGVGNAGDAYTTVGTANATYASAVNVAEFNDATFQGAGFGTFEVVSFDENGGSAEDVVLRTQIGDKVYVSANLVAGADGGNVAAQDLEFTATDGSGSKFTISLAAVSAAINTSTTAATYAENLTSALADVDIYQIRTVTSGAASNLTNTVLEGLSASSVTITSNAFDTIKGGFGDVTSFAGVAGAGTSNQLSVQVNGTTFSATDIGGANDTLSSADSSIVLIGRDAAGNDNNQRITIDITGLTRSIDLTNQDEVSALTNALDSYFGSGSSGAGGLSFQVGSSLSDKIAISIADVSTSKIYVDNAGESQTLAIDTQDGAVAAVEVLDNAISSIISRRADVGAAISRFEFASSNIDVSISNQDAARGSFLDADIAEESTNFATAQVKLQASVAVLAQANQIPQSLLRLIQQ